MYKPPIEIVMKEVFQKLNEDFENSVLKAVQKVGINVDKEELLKALIYDRGQYDEGYEDAMNEIKHPQPLKFEDLKEGMWIYGRMQTVKHALQYYITRPNANEKDLVREKNLLKQVEEDIEWYEERHHIKKKEERK